jgi:hypothetical protein
MKGNNKRERETEREEKKEWKVDRRRENIRKGLWGVWCYNPYKEIKSYEGRFQSYLLFVVLNLKRKRI